MTRAAHEARRRRPAQGRRRRLRDLRQVRRARRHQLRAEHQSSARARRRARPHHPAIDRVQAARVHLVLPERPLFSRDKVEPRPRSCCGARRAGAQQVRAIRHLVASAVNDLKPQRVSVVDEAGRLLADGAGGRRPRWVASADERSSASSGACASRSSRSSPRWSARAARASSSPPSSISTASPRPRQVRSRGPRGALEPDARGILRQRDSRTARLRSATSCRGRSKASRTNRRRSTRPKQEIRGNRQLRDLALHQDRGHRRRPRQARLGRGAGRRQLCQERQGRAQVYQPRSKEEIDRIAALVRTAIGFDQKRGDQVEVVNLRFAEAPARSRSPSRPASCRSCNSPRTTSCMRQSSLP
jgi:flagellar M-ring protein FliF